MENEWEQFYTAAAVSWCKRVVCSVVGATQYRNTSSLFYFCDAAWVYWKARPLDVSAFSRKNFSRIKARYWFYAFDGTINLNIDIQAWMFLLCFIVRYHS